MASKALIAALLAVALASCQTDAPDDKKAQIRMAAAATKEGQAKAETPKLALPAACIAHVDRVPIADEPWVIHDWRWQVSADNRDRKSDDCAAWGADYNRRLAELQAKGGSD